MDKRIALRNLLGKLCQHSQHLVTRMLQDPSWAPSRSQWERLSRIAGGASMAFNHVLRERAKARAEPGVCRYCGCTEDNACLIGGLYHCSWADGMTRTVCSNPDCVDKWKAGRQQKVKAKS